MPKPISLFSGYNQAENRTTNYCLLVLKLLYEENPKFLGEAISVLTDDNIGEAVGVEFNQQEKQAHSTPDAVIRQQAFTVFIETKNFDWFYDRQLAKHLDALAKANAGLSVLLALGNFEAIEEGRFERISELCDTKYENRVTFASASFEDFLAAVRRPELPKNLVDTIADFEEYLNGQNLLPRWKTRLDVVNCATMAKEVLRGQVYICPATGGAYSHKRARYFGMYRNKRVEQITEILAVVDVESETSAKLKWKNVEEADASLVKWAREKLEAWRPEDYPSRVFLLGELHPTDFQKGTKYPMQGSKQYFDIGSLGDDGAAE